MSSAAKSIFYFGVYIAFLGVLLVFFPNALLGLASLPPTGEVWIRLAGMLLIFMGSFYIQAGRHNFTPFFKWTLVTRGVAFFFVLGFWLRGLTTWIMLAFWVGDLAGLLWTWYTLHREAQFKS